MATNLPSSSPTAPSTHAEFNDRVIEPQISVHEQIERSLKPKEEDLSMKDYGSMEPSKTPK
jgi:hypothetical protein